MKYDKDECEKLIDSSPLFSLDEEKEYTAYRREAYRMIDYLYRYLMAVNEAKYEPFALEIVELAKRCIKNYDSSMGRFLNYFVSAWKKEYGHIYSKETLNDTFKGIHFTEEEKRNYKKYMIWAERKGVDTCSAEFDDKIGMAMGLSKEKSEKLRRMLTCRPIPGIVANTEGEEFSVIDQIDSGYYIGEEILQIEEAKEFIEIIELVFGQLQERQKPMISMLITSKLSLIGGDDKKLIDIMKNKSFFDENIFREIISRGEQMEAKEIAERFGVAEASVSRSWKIIKEKINDKMRDLMGGMIWD